MKCSQNICFFFFKGKKNRLLSDLIRVSLIKASTIKQAKFLGNQVPWDNKSPGCRLKTSVLPAMLRLRGWR